MPAFSVSRSIVIHRTREEVFDLVSDFGSWTSWSPWLCIEPEAKVTIHGDGRSLGSIYQWEGELVGAGELEHRRAHPPAEIEDEIRFTKPFKSKSVVRFLLEPVDEGTRLTWQMDGNLPWFLAWMRADMAAYIGMDYERGLKMIRDRIEQGEVWSKVEIVGIEAVPERIVWGVRDSCPMEEIGSAMERAFSLVRSKLSDPTADVNGEMISVYHPVDVKKGRFDFTSGFCLAADHPSPLDGLSRTKLPAGRALHLRHLGSYDHLGNAWSGGYQLARTKKLKLTSGDSYEVYRNDPSQTPESDWLTDVYLPLR